MAITNVKPIKNTGAYLRYITNDQAHTEGKLRMADFKTVNCSLGRANEQLRKISELYNKKDNIRAYSYLFSWSDEELNPNNDEDIEKALTVAESTLKEIAGNDRQMVLVAQNDGVGGKLHIHALVGSIDIKTGKSLRGKTTGHYYLKEVSDRIQKDMNIKNLNSVEHNLEIKESMAEIKMRDRGAYVWKDDLRSRIEEAKETGDFTSFEEFQSYMKDNHQVEVTARNSKKAEAQAFNGEDEKLLSYSFTDEAGKLRKARENKLGASYGAFEIYNSIEHNKSLTEQNTPSKEVLNILGGLTYSHNLTKRYREESQAPEKAELKEEKKDFKPDIPIPSHKKDKPKKVVKVEDKSEPVEKIEDEPRKIIQVREDEEVNEDIIPSLEREKDEEQVRELEEWENHINNLISENLDENDLYDDYDFEY
jgi:hypothetical protein